MTRGESLARRLRRSVGRRLFAFGLGCAASVGLIASVFPYLPAFAQERSEFVHQRYFRVEGPDGESQRALAVFPRRNDAREYPPDARLPVVIALHGQGEAKLGPRRGFLGWYVDYDLPDAYGVLGRGRIWNGDYRGFVTEAHLELVNAELEEGAYEGPMVVTPYTPDLLAEPPGSPRIARWTDWLATSFLDQVRDTFEGAARTRASTGVDGVSLGGMLALEAGFRHPDVFGSVGGIQPAIRGRVEGLAARAAEARHHRGRDGEAHPQHIRLLTSEEDPFLEPTRALSEALREARVPHRLVVLPGPHDYAFNRGPGALELLRFHGEVLPREPLE